MVNEGANEKVFKCKMRIETVNRTHHNNAGQETFVKNCGWNENFQMLYMHGVNLKVIL